MVKLSDPAAIMASMDIDFGEGFAVVDTETTSLDTSEARIVQIAVVHVAPDLSVESSWATLVDPHLDYIGGVSAHQLLPSDLAGAPQFEQVIDTYRRQVAGRVLVAHNAPYDVAVLAAEHSRAGATPPPIHGTIDTLAMTRTAMPSLPNKKLATLAMNLGIVNPHPHQALGDAITTAHVLARLLPVALQRGYRPEMV